MGFGVVGADSRLDGFGLGLRKAGRVAMFWLCVAVYAGFVAFRNRRLSTSN